MMEIRPAIETGLKSPLLTTKQLSQLRGLSECELRRGFKEGIYPAIEIGHGERARRLRWNLEVFDAAIMARMEMGKRVEM